MKKHFSQILLLFIVLSVVSFSIFFLYNPTFSITYSTPNLDSYKFLNNNLTDFREIKMNDVKKIVEDKKGSGIIFLGANYCEFCQRAIKVVNDVALDSNTPIYYVCCDNLSDDEIDVYTDLASTFPDVFPVDKDGNRTFAIPTVMSIYKGKIKSVFTGLIGEVKITKETRGDFILTNEQVTELSSLYKDMIDLSKKGFYFSNEQD